MKIQFARPYYDEQEEIAVSELLYSVRRKNANLTKGENVRLFEEEFKDYIAQGKDIECYCLATSSCGAALELAWLALAQEKELFFFDVVCPALSHVATAHAISYTGGGPQFVDCNDQGNIDLDNFDFNNLYYFNASTLVHYNGIVADVNKIKENCSCPIVEDCALALGSFDKNGIHVGLLGDAGAFSFYPTKHITTGGEGGMFVTKHKELYELAKRIRSFGVKYLADTTYNYDVDLLGSNFRMTEMQAAIGRVQLKKLPEILRMRKKNNLYYRKLFYEKYFTGNGSKIWPVIPEFRGDTYSFVAMCVDKITRDSLMTYLKEKGIGTSILYPEIIPNFSYYKGYGGGTFPNAEAYTNNSIALPIGPHIKRQDIEFIVNEIYWFFQ